MKFSVIIPVYNKANTIDETIHSVFLQTEKSYELIVVNDGSTDNLEKVLKKYKNVRLINQENKGVSEARNTGIKIATGEYICFLDADDLWKENHLTELKELIRLYPNNNMYITSHIETYGERNKSHSSKWLEKYPERFKCENLFKLLNSTSYSILNTNSICIKRSCIEKNNIYFEPGEKIGEDTDMWYRIALYGDVVFTKKETTIYRRENSTATRKGSNTFDWKFAKRWELITVNENITNDRKVECRKLIERYKMLCSRNYMIQKNRTKAKHMIEDIHFHSARFYITWILTRLPYSINEWLLK